MEVIHLKNNSLTIVLNLCMFPHAGSTKELHMICYVGTFTIL